MKISTACPGKSCPIKKLCKRYTAYKAKNPLRYYSTIPYDFKNGKCTKFIEDN